MPSTATDLPLPPELAGLCYQDIHDRMVAEAAAGRWTILDVWDHLPWIQQGGGADWTPWRAFLAALYGLPMTAAELELYQICTGRRRPPEAPAAEAWLIVGRRGRKSAVMSVIGAYEAIYRDHSKYLAPGERARIPVLSKTMGDAQQIKRYVDAIFGAPALRWLVQSSKADVVELVTRCDLAIRAATITAGRGPASPLAILDEIAFFRTDDAAHPDTEILRGIRPSFAHVPGAKLVAASSPYAPKGELYEHYREHWGKDGGGDCLVWKAPTLVMHPDQATRVFVSGEYAKDPIAADAEFGANFRADVQAFVTDDLILSVTDKGVAERLPVPGIQYVAFVDPSGGTSDAYVLAIAHWEASGAVVLDLVDESRPVSGPMSPALETERLCRVCQRYGVRTVEGDRYAGEWPREAFARGFCDHGDEPCIINALGVCGMRYSVAYEVAEQPKRQIYRDTLPLITDARAKLLDIPRMRRQFTDLERRTAHGGDIIDHPPGGQDDVANAVSGVLVRANRLKLQPRVVVEPAKTVAELQLRQIREGIKQRIKEQATRDGGGGPWIPGM